MKLLMLMLLILILYPTNASSFNLNLSDIVKAPSYYSDERVFSDFEIIQVKVTAESKTTGRRLKSKGCYESRYENVPRMPFQSKYIYTPKSSQKSVEAEHNSSKTITIYNLKEKVLANAEDFDDSLPRKCKVTKRATILVKVKMKAGHEEKYRVSLELTKKGFEYTNPVLPARVRDVFGYEELIINSGDSINLGFNQTHARF